MIPSPNSIYDNYLKKPLPLQMTDKIVISLKRQEHKLNVFKDRYQKAGFNLESLTVLEGYDAQSETCPRPYLSLRQIDDLKRERYDHRFFNKSSGYGCYLSHAQAWKWVVDFGKPCIIFEDDAYFQVEKKTPALIEKIIQKIPTSPLSSPYILFLGYIEVPGFKRTFEKTITEEMLGKPFSFKGIMHGLQAYYITPQAAQILLNYAFPIEMQVDSYIGILADVLQHTNQLTLYACKKSLVNQQNVNDSNIQTKCTLCNGHVNNHRFHAKSLMEKREICRKMGGCPPDLLFPTASPSSTSSIGFILAAIAATSLLFVKKK